MNRFEERAMAERKAALRSSMTIWTAGLALMVVICVIIGLSTSASPSFWRTSAVVIAVVLLVIRQLTRRLRSKRGHPEPDPQSRLNLQ